jgi:hypothetical protein
MNLWLDVADPKLGCEKVGMVYLKKKRSEVEGISSDDGKD